MEEIVKVAKETGRLAMIADLMAFIRNNDGISEHSEEILMNYLDEEVSKISK